MTVNYAFQDTRYLKPYLDEVNQEIREREEWNKLWFTPVSTGTSSLTVVSTATVLDGGHRSCNDAVYVRTLSLSVVLCWCVSSALLVSTDLHTHFALSVFNHTPKTNFCQSLSKIANFSITWLSFVHTYPFSARQRLLNIEHYVHRAYTFDQEGGRETDVCLSVCLV